MKDKTDKIELLLPLKAEYVSLARLTASGVANRVGFDIETIEDIKVAISEVCSKLVSVGSNSAENYSIKFIIQGINLRIEFNCEDQSLGCIFKEDEEGLGVSIINALMDDVEFCSSGSYLFSMSIALKGDN
ncbi:MAG: ATP-binding protein [Clostridia bacterium]|nr:ATP-binding protein [Clostridia bacterium]